MDLFKLSLGTTEQPSKSNQEAGADDTHQNVHQAAQQVVEAEEFINNHINEEPEGRNDTNCDILELVRLEQEFRQENLEIIADYEANS